ncbi:MAG: acetyl-CoA carboxylase carboxyltransferase subunit beta [Candidatus Cloacimonadota bacterium]|nr:MAG: acetyl-CoA carboxylase carboxyltransferase subunit beta [Candidatus Cloacimonadota bacterium]
MKWFRRKRKLKPPEERKTVPDGLWQKCKGCGEILYGKELERNHHVCKKCGFHFRIGSSGYVKILLDDGLTEHDVMLSPLDPLKFDGYPRKIREIQERTGLKEAIIAGEGMIGGFEVEFAAMDFSFVGGSMGSVVGEKVKRAILRAKGKKIPLIIVSSSGGARMQEGILSLMQMAKTGSALAELEEARIPFISILTNPTTAGVMASYSSIGDIIISEPGALLGFAGPRVIEQTIKQKLPEGFQKAQFLLEHGFIDIIVERKDLKDTIIKVLRFFLEKN